MTDPRKPTFVDLVREMMRAELAETHVAKPGIVLSYDPVAQTAAVQPLFKVTFRTEIDEERTESAPVLPSVPIAWPGWGGWIIDGELAPEDLVLLVFADRAIDAWEASPLQQADPSAARMHAFNDAIGLPFLSAGRASSSGDAPLRLRRADGQPSIELLADGGIRMNAGGEADQPAVRGDELVAWLQSHTHPTAFGPSGPPVQPIPPTILSALLRLR